ncbi:hypothetical protein PGT21_029473 [Puccinia graminis f. sp. tritici]|uniref:Uncharacterized protein n=1 Tax=Puccinia graminis f. sp. tritici TaxID=56615 RepID=A0A5B0LYX8_PUCGR|nr:hypothetical protein PGT21_029473 [Puccinia graminis f. sp. tritici]KAA1112178.1 hypothetical protein PGTUg99_003939 [Puccinia graminis f. sp. tritici]
MAEYEGQVALTRSTREAKKRCVASEQAYIGAQDDRASNASTNVCKGASATTEEAAMGNFLQSPRLHSNTLSRQESAPHSPL